LTQPSIAVILRSSERCLSESQIREFSERAKWREAQGTRAAGKELAAQGHTGNPLFKTSLEFPHTLTHI
jgi:hypothetical protein